MTIEGFAHLKSRASRLRRSLRSDKMDRRLARRNMITGLVAGALAVIIFGATFLAAGLYLD